jgi:hypothetical protein
MKTRRRPGAVKKSKRGKPRLPQGTAKTLVLACKVSAVEMGLCDQLAAHHGIERSEVVRRALHVAAALPQLLASTEGAKVQQTLKNFLREIVVETVRDERVLGDA